MIDREEKNMVLILTAFFCAARISQSGVTPQRGTVKDMAKLAQTIIEETK